MVYSFNLLGGYKGYGLSMMVEVFCGILAGADFGGNIRKWKTTEKEANLVSYVSAFKYLKKLYISL